MDTHGLDVGCYSSQQVVAVTGGATAAAALAQPSRPANADGRWIIKPDSKIDFHCMIIIPARCVNAFGQGPAVEGDAE